MIFLPVVERELRVASRKRSTFWVRVIAAIIGLTIGTGFFILTVNTFGPAPISLGKALFATLTWLSLAVALSAGLFFTADCLSEEKREGTLGFLFLTDLRGYDVVLGKLLATSLRGSFALLAVLPILATTLLMGGVTGAQFWKTTLALVNALFLSLAAGLFVSAISRDSQKAMAGTLLLLVLLAAVGPTLGAILSRFGYPPFLSFSSPVYLFREAGAWGKTYFWPALLGNQIVAWLLFGASCLLLPRTWQEKTSKTSLAQASWEQRWKFGGAKHRLRLRKKLMSVNPVLWLACRERWQAMVLWAMTLVTMTGFAALFAIGQDMLWFVWNYLSGAVSLALYLGLASQSGRLFVEAGRSGLTELLLVTPLTVEEIVQGQWRALLRMFGVPLALCVAAQAAGSAFAQKMMFAGMSAAIAAAPTTAPGPITNANTPGPMSNTISSISVSTGMMTVTTTTTAGGAVTTFTLPGSPPPVTALMLATSISGALTTIGNLAALCWFGMWMGLNSKNTSLATLKTLAFVQIAPWFVISFASAMIVPIMLLLPNVIRKGGTANLAQFNVAQFMYWFPALAAVIAAMLYLAKDIAFVVWARRKLYSSFRERAVQGLAPMRPALPPKLPVPPGRIDATATASAEVLR